MDFKNFEEALASFKKELLEVKGTLKDENNSPTSDYTKLCSMMDSLAYMMSDTNKRLDNHYKRMTDHQNGHIPPMMGPGQMAKALKTLGLDGDYQVEKRPVYASIAKLDFDFKQK